MTWLSGIDVHGSKGTIGWDDVRASGQSFAFVKASEGGTFRDALTRQNVGGALAAGLEVGCYHFARPDLNRDPHVEADNFLSCIDGLPWTLAPVLDIERGDGDLSAWALTFLRRVQKDLRVTPALYTYSGFASGRLGHDDLKSYPLWLANYRSDTSVAPYAPRPWSGWYVWQHTSSGDTPGVPGRCDMNRADATVLESLRVLKNGRPPYIPAPSTFGDDPMRSYLAVRVPPPDDLGRQCCGLDVDGNLLGVWDDTSSVCIKANDNGVAVRATVQPFSFSGMLGLSFGSLDGKPVPEGLVGIVVEHR